MRARGYEHRARSSKEIKHISEREGRSSAVPPAPAASFIRTASFISEEQRQEAVPGQTAEQHRSLTASRDSEIDDWCERGLEARA